ncbi:MAG TPA: 4Fe-4S binding protein [Candidatus Competibacteraceae bacterium]|nr:4Fe-4S binding protein [Candidatus Competibacteraceae bacterium]
MWNLVRGLLWTVSLVLALVSTVTAGALGDYLGQARSFFPQADRFGASEGSPPAAPVYRGQELLGYVFQTDDVEKIPAYSGKPVNLLIGLDIQGKITGAKVLEHHEPILLVGIPEQALSDFAGQYIGKSIADRIKVGAGHKEGYVNVDAITGATVTVMVVNEAILRSARKVAISRGIMKSAAAEQRPPARLRMELFEPADWLTLTGNGAIRSLRLTRGDVDAAFKGTQAEGVESAKPGQEGDTFIELYYTYLNIPIIGRNLLGDTQYAWLMRELKPGEHAIAVLGNGLYSFKGSGYVRGGIFDRLQLQQGNQTISFRDLDHIRLSDVYAAGMPKFQEMAIFIVRDRFAFEPSRPWELELLVRRQTGPLASVFTSFSGEYLLPEQYLELPPAPLPAAQAGEQPEPIWREVWRERVFQIAVLASGLVVLTLILLFQDVLVRYPRFLWYLRNGFLLYTLLFIGWYSLAQLSVVNVLTFTNAVFHEFKWDTFLIDPMMFILWSFVAMTLLLWGRGVYCGWLCPFGALQELVNEIALRLRLPQWQLPFALNERLWAIKYLILLVLFAVSLQSLAEAERLAEVEPFKTAITLRFIRDWGYVLYAGGMVVVSLFVRKAYCRYLCPLGAALAVPARLRLFDWLKRRRECGKPCQICALECEVQAIHPTGEINANECHYCLDCQVTYFNERKCPPLVDRRRRQEKAAALRQAPSGETAPAGHAARRRADTVAGSGA